MNRSGFFKTIVGGIAGTKVIDAPPVEPLKEVTIKIVMDWPRLNYLNSLKSSGKQMKLGEIVERIYLRNEKREFDKNE